VSSTLGFDQLETESGSGNIVLPTNNRLRGTDIGSISASGSIVQMQQISDMPTAHIISNATTETSVPLIASITPRFSSSLIKVEFYSQMMLGSANILNLILYRRINGSAWSVLTPITGTGSRYTFGWSYNNNAWSPYQNRYIDTPNTTGFVEYVVNYRNWSSTATNYVVHQYQEYGYILTEIAQ
jgi:hypothetical protein